MQKEKTYFGLYKARRRRRFFGGIFGMRNFGLNFPPPYFFKKVVRRGGEVGSNTADDFLLFQAEKHELRPLQIDF